MVVYIEYVVADNFVFTALICYLGYKLLREKVRWCRCLIAASVGTVCALMYPFIKNIAISLVFKLVLYILLCLILYGGLPKFLRHSIMFLVATALIGGIEFMIGFVVHGNASAALRLPISELPLSVFFLPPLLLFVLSKKVLSIINAHRLKQNYIYDFELTIGQKSMKLKGLIDTGHSVKAEKEVVFVNQITAFRLLGGDYIKLIASSSASTIVHTVLGNKKIILLPGKIELYYGKDEHIFMDVQVGISDVKSDGEYEAILPLSILCKEKAL